MMDRDKVIDILWSAFGDTEDIGEAFGDFAFQVLVTLAATGAFDENALHVAAVEAAKDFTDEDEE